MAMNSPKVSEPSPPIHIEARRELGELVVTAPRQQGQSSHREVGGEDNQVVDADTGLGLFDHMREEDLTAAPHPPWQPLNTPTHQPQVRAFSCMSTPFKRFMSKNQGLR